VRSIPLWLFADRRRDDRRGRTHLFVTGALAALFLAVLVRTAWVCDDAFITFRTVDNFLNGYGLRWNTAERVQSFTHPLWMFLYAVPYAVTGDPYVTSIWLSIVVSTLAFGLALWTAQDLWMAIAGAFLLLSSRAFVDYSTSGLENPLTHLLLAVFATAWFRRDARVFQAVLFVTGGLVMLNRQDTLLLVLPGMIAVGVAVGVRRFVFLALVGAVPVIVWESFSLLYYGLLVPNTAFAKLNTGADSMELFRQGLTYLRDSFDRDPLVLPTTVAGGVLAVVRWRAGALPLGVGILLYLSYVVIIGGDFMTGRFLAAPYFLAVLTLIRFRLTPRVLAPAVAAGVLAAAFAGYDKPVFASGRDFGVDDHIDAKIDRITGIADERRYYYPDTGYLRVSSRGGGGATSLHEWADTGRRYRHERRKVVVSGIIGFVGFYAGPDVRIVDCFALTDPLLARLPAQPLWRIGHFMRRLPEGYLATLSDGGNRLVHPEIAALYEDVRQVVAGPIWSVARFKSIWRLQRRSVNVNHEYEADRSACDVYLSERIPS
jgi:arabinofuranosyltransferase